MIRYYALYYLIHASRIEQPAKTITKDEVLHSSKLYNAMIAVLFLVLFFKLQSFLDLLEHRNSSDTRLCLWKCKLIFTFVVLVRSRIIGNIVINGYNPIIHIGIIPTQTDNLSYTASSTEHHGKQWLPFQILLKIKTIKECPFFLYCECMSYPGLAVPLLIYFSHCSIRRIITNDIIPDCELEGGA